MSECMLLFKKIEFAPLAWPMTPWVHLSPSLDTSEEDGFNFACSFGASVPYLFVLIYT